MKERPIILGPSSVNAVLKDRKTQTRRVCKRAYATGEASASVHPDGAGTGWIAWYPNAVSAEQTKRFYPGAQGFKCPYGVPGDRLWVREAFAVREHDGEDAINPDGRKFSEVCYSATPRVGIRTPPLVFESKPYDPMTYLDESTPLEQHSLGWPLKWRSPILMPRRFARLVLEVTEVRVERLQGISDEDANAEGHGMTWGRGCFHRSFAGGWDELNAKRGYSWDSNPWVWVVSFRRIPW